MKHVLLVVLVALFSSTASAEDVCPEFANMVNVISEDGKSSKELSMEKAVAKQKKKGIYRGWDNSVRLEGAAAKISVGKSPAFAFKPLNAEVHPAQQIKLYPFDTKKDYRELSVGGTRAWGGSKDKKAEDDSVPIEIEKITKGCYKVKAGVELPPGEYAFNLGSIADVKGTNAGWGSSVEGQVWFGFTVK